MIDISFVLDLIIFLLVSSYLWQAFKYFIKTIKEFKS
jgi:hypothetical protein